MCEGGSWVGERRQGAIKCCVFGIARRAQWIQELLWSADARNSEYFRLGGRGRIVTCQDCGHGKDERFRKKKSCKRRVQEPAYRRRKMRERTRGGVKAGPWRAESQHWGCKRIKKSGSRHCGPACSFTFQLHTEIEQDAKRRLIGWLTCRSRCPSPRKRQMTR